MVTVSETPQAGPMERAGDARYVSLMPLVNWRAIGPTLTAAMRQVGLSNEELARRVLRTPGTTRQYLTGRKGHAMRVDTLIQLVSGMGGRLLLELPEER